MASTTLSARRTETETETASATDRVRALLLEVAAREFSSRGFAGARLEQIAADANITRAMIYYHFGGREGLYVAVLEDAYNAIWRAEHAIRIDDLEPIEALRRLVEFRVSYYIDHPTFVALVSIENQLEAKHLRRVESVTLSAAPSLEHTAAVLAQGQAQGVFRRDVDVVDLYQVIVSMGFFNVANRHTFGAIFGRDFADGSHMRTLVVDVVLRYVSTEVGALPEHSARPPSGKPPESPAR
jgi:AcrR family transcriptional regulator